MPISADRVPRFLREILRRRVPQTAGAYLVFGVMVLEGSDYILPSLGVPAEVLDILPLLVVAGLPFVVAGSWIWDITWSGLVRTGESDAGAPGGEVRAGDSASTPRRGSGGRVATGAAFPRLPEPGEVEGAAAVAAQAWPGVSPDEAIESLAVLPFATAAHDEDSDYLADGIAESIINRMSRISGLRVCPRSSSFRIRDETPELSRVAEQLHVRAVVMGRLKMRGSQILVQAELIDLANESQIWGERYQRPVADVLEIEEEIATRISQSLQLELTREDEERLRTRATTDTEAYRHYLRGRYHWNRRTADGFRRATEHFREAIRIDPEYARAYTGLSDTYNVLGYYNVQAPRDSYEPAMAAARRALEIDPELAEAHASLAYALLFYSRDWEAARNHFEAAIEHDPRYASAHQWYGWYLLIMERFEETVESMERALALDPLSLVINDHLAYAYILAGRLDDAGRQIRRTQSLDPHYPLAIWRLGNWHRATGDLDEAIAAYRECVEITEGGLCLGYLGLALGEAGCTDEARAILARMDDDEKGRYVSPLDRALVYAGLGELDGVFYYLDEALTTRVSDAARMHLLAWPAPVVADPRFDAMVARLELHR